MNRDEIIPFLMSKITVDEKYGCWNWMGGVNSCGYSQFYFKGENERGHRLSYEIFKGKIPDGLCLDHLCRNKRCVNPDHLEPVTRKENATRGISGRIESLRTECPKNHKYDDKNTYVTPTGKRDCRECRKQATERYKKRKSTVFTGDIHV